MSNQQVERIKIRDVNVGDIITLDEFGKPKYRVEKIEEDHRILWLIKARFVVVDMGNGHLFGKKFGLKRSIKRAIS